MSEVARRALRALVIDGHSGMVRRTRPGISRFRVRCCASPRNDGSIGYTLTATSAGTNSLCEIADVTR